MTNHADLINGALEAVGAFFVMMDVMRLRRDKVVHGVYWPGRAFFMLWGVWNLYFYPYYEAYASFVGGVMLVLANLIWVALAIKYRGESK